MISDGENAYALFSVTDTEPDPSPPTCTKAKSLTGKRKNDPLRVRQYHCLHLREKLSANALYDSFSSLGYVRAKRVSSSNTRACRGQVARSYQTGWDNGGGFAGQSIPHMPNRQVPSSPSSQQSDECKKPTLSAETSQQVAPVYTVLRHQTGKGVQQPVRES